MRMRICNSNVNASTVKFLRIARTPKNRNLFNDRAKTIYADDNKENSNTRSPQYMYLFVYNIRTRASLRLCAPQIFKQHFFY